MTNPNHGKGYIVAVDGVDGCGKTTVVDLLRMILQEECSKINREFHTVRFPGGTKLGTMLRNVIKSKEYGEIDPIAERLMFAADMQQTFSKVVEPAYKRGALIICDRFSPVTDYAYGSALGMDLSVIKSIQKTTQWFPCDHMFIIDPEWETIKFRKERMNELPGTEKCRIEDRGMDFLQSVHQWYREFFNEGKAFRSRGACKMCTNITPENNETPRQIADFIISKIPTIFGGTSNA